MSDRKTTTRRVVKESLPDLEARLRARLRLRVVAMYDAATDLINAQKAAENPAAYGKAGNE